MYNLYKAGALVLLGYILGTMQLKIITLNGQQFYHFTAMHDIIKVNILKTNNGSTTTTTPSR